jgi:hypothetical protein
MLRSTLDAVKAICAADPSINAAQVKAAIAELSGDGVREMRGEPPPRAFSVAQVAELTGKSRRTISLYARRGLLTPIYSGATGKRAQAYTGESVAALLSGKARAKGSEVAA